MADTSPIGYDAATALSRGARPYQEDTLIADFGQGTGVGFAVLADGMGGHAAGDVASRIIVIEMFNQLKFQMADQGELESDISAALKSAAESANEKIARHVAESPEHDGMGATLLSPVIFGTRLYWISIGDSPLYLVRNGKMKQLNEDHSMASQINLMVENGQLTEEQGRDHPDRNALTSVMMGERISRMDCTGNYIEIQPGDIVITASDGIQYLADNVILSVVMAHEEASSAVIAGALMAEIKRLNDPHQDNTAICVFQLERASRASQIATRRLKEKPVTTRRQSDATERYAAMPDDLTPVVPAAAPAGQVPSEATSPLGRYLLIAGVILATIVGVLAYQMYGGSNANVLMCGDGTLEDNGVCIADPVLEVEPISQEQDGDPDEPVDSPVQGTDGPSQEDTQGQNGEGGTTQLEEPSGSGGSLGETTDTPSEPESPATGEDGVGSSGDGGTRGNSAPRGTGIDAPVEPSGTEVDRQTYVTEIDNQI